MPAVMNVLAFEYISPSETPLLAFELRAELSLSFLWGIKPPIIEANMEKGCISKQLESRVLSLIWNLGRPGVRTPD
jgi:hypothetical protein